MALYTLQAYKSEYQDDPGVLVDISIPVTLTDIEVFYYTNCTQVMTAHKTVFIAGTAFSADPIIFTFANPETPLFLTYHYPQVTLTSLTEQEVLTYVCLSTNSTNPRWNLRLAQTLQLVVEDRLRISTIL